DNYLRKSANLKAVFLLLDIRHKPSENDLKMYEWIIKSGRPPVIIATKADKIKRSQLNKHMDIIRVTLNLNKETQIIAYSDLNKQGRNEIYDLITSLST
ncbi:MAG: YihA family ribosome biogenesis GTP-binding protein, partial [Lachnospiraceae bacterium]|nr:YihA family ribosome biogenesis GTP-binding protein [Lachnospiraceae bacterium]